MTHGRFEVVGPREYRGHPAGTRFEAKMDAPLQRAIGRGSIRLLEVVEPKLVPGSYALPDDWPVTANTPNETPSGVSLVRGGGK